MSVLWLEFVAVESVDELSVEAEKLSFLNGVLCFFVVDIFSFSLNFFIMIFVFLFCKSAIFPAFKTLYSPSVWVI